MPLRPLAEADLDRVRVWRNAPEVRRWMYTQHEISEAEHRAWFASLQGDPKRSCWIYDDPQIGLCGVVSFTDRNETAKTASWGFYAAPGSPRGAGTRMELEALDLAFGPARLHKLNCEVLAGNESVVQLHRKFGFVEEGCFRRQYFDGEQRHDVIRLGLLAAEWRVHRPAMLKRIARLDKLRAAGRGGGGLRRLLILSDPGSWIRPFVQDAMVEWSEQGYDVALRAAPDPDETADVCFCLSYGRILSTEVRRRFGHTLIVHASALPEGRGWSPMTWQILEGRKSFTVTLLAAADKVDSGDIYLQQVISLDGTELLDCWRNDLATATLDLCGQWLSQFPTILSGVREQTGEPTFYRKRGPADSRLDPACTLESQFHLLRTVDNARYPAWFDLHGARYRLTIEKAASECEE